MATLLHAQTLASPSAAVHTSVFQMKCKCPLYVMGTREGKFIRRALDTRSLERAAQLIREMETGQVSISLSEAIERFLDQGKASGLSSDTLNKYGLLERELDAFFPRQSLRSISTDDLSKFRESWQMSNVTARKKIERMRAFFNFCVDRDWVRKNPAKGLKLPKENHLPTLPFTKTETEKIEWAIELYPERPKGRRTQVKAFVLLLTHTGLRIRDVVCMKQSDVEDGKVLIRTQKTGVKVHLPIPENLVEILKSLPPDDYFFWSGLGEPKSAVADWQRSLRKLFKLAGIENGHAHRFRDTMATELLQRGVTLENVAAILGNTVKVCERHYAPWTLVRQQVLEDAVRKTWT